MEGNPLLDEKGRYGIDHGCQLALRSSVPFRLLRNRGSLWQRRHTSLYSPLQGLIVQGDWRLPVSLFAGSLLPPESQSIGFTVTYRAEDAPEYHADISLTQQIQITPPVADFYSMDHI
ncbi:hypothetical protein FRB95_003646 [Tulasnella sp. JGI-2019a]|nr:hypothetical protein FRB95_003646 [Tulasnella sp. JGI-2019a]